MSKFSFFITAGLCAAIALGSGTNCPAQQTKSSSGSPAISEKAQKMIDNGEFSLALDYAQSFSGKSQVAGKNQVLRSVASAQKGAGASSAAVQTLSLQSGGSNQIADGFRQLIGQGPAANLQQFGQLTQSGFGTGFGNQTGNQGFGNNQNQNQNGQFGGGAQADFTALIDLIQATITPDDWDTGSGGAQSIIEFPNGVLVDAKGLMRFQKKPSPRPSIGKLIESTLVKRSDLRMISLPKLEQQLIGLAAAGKPVPESIQYLGGMYDVHYVTIDKNSGDLFLVGPAGPWTINRDGIAVNKKNGKAVLQLDDLVVAMRSTQKGTGVFGCSIDARRGQYERFSTMVGRLRKVSKSKLNRVAVAVGPSDANVFGVPQESHAAWSMLAADYHMKLLAMGNVPSTTNVPDYMMLCGDENSPVEKIRWWFTLGQPTITTNQDQTEYKISGQIVKLKTENQVFAAAGQRGARVSIPAMKFVNNFNKNFQEVAAQYPLYGKLENLFELTIAAQILKTHSLDKQIRWQPTFLMGADPNFGYALKAYPVPKEVALVVQMKKLRPKRGQRAGDVLISVSGGVTANIDAKFIKKQTRNSGDPTLSYKLASQVKEASKKETNLPDYVQRNDWSTN